MDQVAIFMSLNHRKSERKQLEIHIWYWNLKDYRRGKLAFHEGETISPGHLDIA